MKTRLLIIIGITISTIITVSVVSLQYFDTQKYSKENPYGFSAKVFYTKEFLSRMCPVPNACQTHLQLKIWSNISAILQGYKICNGFSCLEFCLLLLNQYLLFFIITSTNCKEVFRFLSVSIIKIFGQTGMTLKTSVFEVYPDLLPV